jgi:hypothetical protein
MSALTMKQLAMQCAMLTPIEKEIARSGAATVTFEDHGQDFLVWHIKDRHVVGCEPFQADIWTGLEITTLPMFGLRMGIRGRDGVERFIKYPIAKLEPFRMEGAVS